MENKLFKLSLKNSYIFFDDELMELYNSLTLLYYSNITMEWTINKKVNTSLLLLMLFNIKECKPRACGPMRQCRNRLCFSRARNAWIALRPNNVRFCSIDNCQLLQ